MSTPRVPLSTLAAVLFLVVTPALSAAQDLAPAPGQSGPLVLSPISDSVVLSPDIKITTVNGATAVLAGGYIGKLFEKTILIGAGAYWLADPRDDARLFYGGLIVGGRVLGNDRCSLTARGLVGLGSGTVFQAREISGYPHPFGHDERFRPVPAQVVQTVTVRIGYDDVFWVAEPEARVVLQLSDMVNLNAGAGYRVTSAYGGLYDLFRGATGSIGIQFNLK